LGFGPLHHIIPGFTIFHELPPVFLRFFTPFITSSLLGRPLVLIPIGFQSVIFLTGFISSSLLRCLHHFILGGELTFTSTHTHTHTHTHTVCQKKIPEVRLTSADKKQANLPTVAVKVANSTYRGC
jgi:hypothetical protein